MPTGRVWKMPYASNLRRLFRTLSKREAQFKLDAQSTLDSILPDNDRFTEDDATDWERRLGMINGSANPLSVRKLAIRRKMAAPGVNPAKGHYLWIQQQLQDAGFPVYLYENIFPVYPTGYTTMNPADFNPNILSVTRYGNTNYGQKKYGKYINHLVVNSLENSEDIGFNIGANLRATFFIGGSPIGTYAVIPATREKEFRQLILNLKQVQNVAILFITYT